MMPPADLLPCVQALPLTDNPGCAALVWGGIALMAGFVAFLFCCPARPRAPPGHWLNDPGASPFDLIGNADSEARAAARRPVRHDADVAQAAAAAWLLQQQKQQQQAPASGGAEPFTDDFFLGSRGQIELHGAPQLEPEPEPEPAPEPSFGAGRAAAAAGGPARQNARRRRKRATCCARPQHDRLHAQQGRSGTSSGTGSGTSSGTTDRAEEGGTPSLEPAKAGPARLDPQRSTQDRPWLSGLSPAERQALNEMREEGGALLDTAHEQDPLLRPQGEVRGVVSVPTAR